jgi:SH3-like domain-containing protein
VINKPPEISAPAPVAITAAVAPSGGLASTSAAWRPAWVTSVVARATEPTSLTLEHVNAAVNVRAAGRKGAPVLFVLPRGAEIRVAEKQGGWVHVYSDQGEGWIYSSLVGTPRAAPPAEGKKARLSGKTMRVAGNATVRDAPGGEPLYQLEGGEPIRVVATKGKWALIATSSGEGGWVRVR